MAREYGGFPLWNQRHRKSVPGSQSSLSWFNWFAVWRLLWVVAAVKDIRRDDKLQPTKDQNGSQNRVTTHRHCCFDYTNSAHVIVVSLLNPESLRSDAAQNTDPHDRGRVLVVWYRGPGLFHVRFA